KMAQHAPVVGGHSIEPDVTRQTVVDDVAGTLEKQGKVGFGSAHRCDIVEVAFPGKQSADRRNGESGCRRGLTEGLSPCSKQRATAPGPRFCHRAGAPSSAPLVTRP